LSALPDVLGFQLDEALNLLKSLNVSILIQETYPPDKQARTGECRVVRQIDKGDCVELIVSYF